MTALESRIRWVRGDGGQRLWRGTEVRPVVLADREHVEAELVGELRLLQEVGHALMGADAGAEVGERGESEFHAAILRTS